MSIWCVFVTSMYLFFLEGWRLLDKYVLPKIAPTSMSFHSSWDWIKCWSVYMCQLIGTGDRWQLTHDTWHIIFFLLFLYFCVGATIHTRGEMQWLPIFFFFFLLSLFFFLLPETVGPFFFFLHCLRELRKIMYYCCLFLV